MSEVVTYSKVMIGVLQPISILDPTHYHSNLTHFQLLCNHKYGRSYMSNIVALIIEIDPIFVVVVILELLNTSKGSPHSIQGISGVQESRKR